ncbi:MAG TPA: LytTR family DNA-binding domain-containing protein [Terriglobia bacterium]|nr:LytTR family DNA-binding domain-containing protein [Terriglobia bacterium]
MTTRPLLRVYLVDDESLALKRLTRLLRQTRRVDIVGSTMSPDEAVKFLSNHAVDAVFLDIQMPGMTGFELLQKLPKEPLVVFTTAFDRFALDAFEVNSIDYLLKPIELDRLEKALSKVERLRGTPQALSESEQLRAIARELTRKFPERIASRLGERVVFVEVGKVSHFYAKDKLTYAATASKDYVIDLTISDLEQKLDPALFLRIHRATLLNLNFVDEVSAWFGGGMVVRLKDGKRTELQISRDRLREVKERLEF